MVAIVLAVLVVGVAVAQWRRGGGRGFSRQLPSDGSLPSREGVPEWKNEPGFENDVFTFVRIEYQSDSWRGRGGGWATDWPASDLNFSFRLQQLTSLKVDPVSKYFRLTNPKLFDYPFIYLIEPGSLYFDDAEVGRTEIIMETLEPAWDNTTFDVPLPPDLLGSELVVDVYDWDEVGTKLTLRKAACSVLPCGCVV